MAGDEVLLWDAEKGTPLLSWEQDCFALCFSPDGSRLATTSGREGIKIYDVADLTGAQDANKTQQDQNEELNRYLARQLATIGIIVPGYEEPPPPVRK